MTEAIVKVVSGSGPFGHYPDRSLGLILNQMCDEGIPLTKVETCTGSSTPGGGQITGSIHGEFRWLGNTNLPLFHWELKAYRDVHRAVHYPEGIRPVFRLQLDPDHSKPMLRIEGNLLTESLYDHLKAKFFDKRIDQVLEFNVIKIKLLLVDSQEALQFVQELNDHFVYKDLDG